MKFDLLNFWDSLVPYLYLIENIFGINREDLRSLIPHMSSPVLVVGAGQGLLVEELRRNGLDAQGVDYSLEMVAYARKRRGIQLYHARADNMPFEDDQFMTSVVATGVLDFIEDNKEIKSIINEVGRVTSDQGKIFAVFILYTPQYEELCRYMGIISENERYCLGISYKWIIASRQALSELRKSPNKSLAGYFLRSIKAFINNPRLMSAQIRSLMKIGKLIKSGEVAIPEGLFDMAEQLPYRNREQIHGLFRDLDILPSNVFESRNCYIVQF